MPIHEMFPIALQNKTARFSVRSILTKVSLCVAFACLTGLMAQIKWFLPGNPVPFTLQTAAVIMSALWLKRWGALSQLLYLGLGFCGIPWFANQASGLNVLFLPTAGYLIGFVFTSFIGGWLVEKYYNRFRFFTSIGLFIVTILFTHGFGILYLQSWMVITHQGSISFPSLLLQGTLPFIGFDLVKILISTGIYSLPSHNQ